MPNTAEKKLMHEHGGASPLPYLGKVSDIDPREAGLFRQPACQAGFSHAGCPTH